MGRKPSKPRSQRGARLAQLRKDAGLSQMELARRVGVPQQNIAYWEISDKPPRSDIVPKLAKVLGVTVEELLAPASSKTKAAAKALPTPIGKLRRVFELAALLPRYQQDKLADLLAPFVNQFFINKPFKNSSKLHAQK